MDKIEIINYKELTNFLKDEKDKLKKIIHHDIKNSNLSHVHICKDILNKNICDYIIYESELYSEKNGGWTNKRHQNYPTTDLPVKTINNISILVQNFVIHNILPLFAKHFDLNLYHLNINDLFVVKYEHDKQNHLDFHRDGNLLSFNILLNEHSEFEGGGTIIQHSDGDILYNIKKGDLILHSGKIMHSGNKITSGKRYLLVGFISYLFNF